MSTIGGDRMKLIKLGDWVTKRSGSVGLSPTKTPKPMKLYREHGEN
jgi:hypothetical protein